MGWFIQRAISLISSTNGPRKHSSKLVEPDTMLKADFMARARYHCLTNLITNVFRMTECNLVYNLEHNIGYAWLQADKLH